MPRAADGDTRPCQAIRPEEVRLAVECGEAWAEEGAGRGDERPVRRDGEPGECQRVRDDTHAIPGECQRVRDDTHAIIYATPTGGRTEV
jgi:hypothetical protein